MTTLLLPLVLGQLNAKPIFDRSLAAHQALKAASVTVKTESRLVRQTIRNSFQLSYIRPDRLSMRVTEKGADRSYFVLGNSFVGFDRTYREYLTRPAPAKATLLERMGLVMQNVDESIQPILDPKVLTGLYSKFRNLTGWTKSDQGATFRLLRYSGPAKNGIGAAFFFDKKNYLLRGVTLLGGDNIVVWRYEYGATPKTIAFVPPADALKVSSFLEARPQPKYKDVAAKQVAEGSARAYDALRHVELIASSPGVKSHIWSSSGRLRERQGMVDWTFTNGVLTVLDLRKKRLYRGKSLGSDVPGHLQKLGLRMDPVIRQLGVRKNPARVILEPGAKVRRAGSISLGGAMCDILEIEGAPLRITAWIRQKDKLLQTVETRHVDTKGRTVYSSTKDYQYLSLGKPLPTAAFELGNGLKPLKLSQIRK